MIISPEDMSQASYGVNNIQLALLTSHNLHKDPSQPCIGRCNIPTHFDKGIQLFHRLYRSPTVLQHIFVEAICDKKEHQKLTQVRCRCGCGTTFHKNARESMTADETTARASREVGWGGVGRLPCRCRPSAGQSPSRGVSSPRPQRPAQPTRPPARLCTHSQHNTGADV